MNKKLLNEKIKQYRYIGSLDITIPQYNDLIPLLPWHIVISGFHCRRQLIRHF